MKNIVIRFLNGFCYSIAITLCVVLFVLVVAGKSVMLPEFVLRRLIDHAVEVLPLLGGDAGKSL